MIATQRPTKFFQTPFFRPWPTSRSQMKFVFARYGLPIFLTGVMLFLRLELDCLSLTHLRVFFTSIIISSWYGGLGPGIFASLLAAMADLFFFTPPGYSFKIAGINDVIEVGSFAFVAMTISAFTGLLHRAKQDALDLAQQKENFLANISHEIRTPLSAVRGLTEHLLTQEQPQDQREVTQVIKKSSDDLLSLINKLLDMSKILAGNLEIEQIEFDPFQEVDHVTRLLMSKLRQKDISFNFSVEGKVPQNVLGDAGKLRQILTNLLDNAIRFTDKNGTITVKIWVDGTSEDRTTLYFEVKDNGIGIPDSVQTKIFEPFTQADVSTARKYGGTGLGLSICKQLVTLMGGELFLKSREGKGSSFWFSLPVKISTLNLNYVRSSKPVRVLVVEDTPENQMVSKVTLGRLGYDVEIVSSGEEALEVFQSDIHDLILMDCSLPQMDGYETTRRIRMRESKEAKKPVPIIAMTAAESEKIRVRCLEAGMNDFSEKLSKTEDLSRLLKKWIRSSQPS